MFQIGAAGHHLKHSVIGDVITARNLQMSQLRTTLSHHMQAAVSEPLTAVDHHRLQRQTHIRGVLAQPVGQDSNGAVSMKQLSC